MGQKNMFVIPATVEPSASKSKAEKRRRTVAHIWKSLVTGSQESGKRHAPDTLLAVYGERVTYTFIMGQEIASIHFDRQRGEIFFRGHNIRQLELSGPQREALLSMKKVLSVDPKGRALFEGYCATLDRLLADNK